MANEEKRGFHLGKGEGRRLCENWEWFTVKPLS